MKTMQAKYPGTCCDCGKPIERGQTIKFFGRGRASHQFCFAPNGETPRSAITNGSHEDYPCSDQGYEDACARACGPGL